jgi:citrate lyase subunit beta / citryl-CoA lyase
MLPIRSLLMCTANVERQVRSAISGKADAVVFDLETTVLDSEKPAARAALAKTLAAPSRPQMFVRINEVDSPHVFDDLVDLVCPGLAGVMIPRAEDARQMQIVDWALSRLEERSGRSGMPTEILPLVETARGVENLTSMLSASSRIRRATFGVADYSLDTGIRVSPDERELAYVRSRMVHASRACGLEQPIDTVWLDFADTEGMRRSMERSKCEGFFGRLCIHPRQAELANAVFSPTSEELEMAHRIVSAFDTAKANKVAAINLDGRLVDGPIAANAERLIARARLHAAP